MENYDIGQVLGRGGFATVYRARNRSSGKEVAVKMLDKERMAEAGMTERVVAEVKLHWRLRHLNVVQLLEFFEDAHCVYMVMELCSGGDLYKLLRVRKKFNEDEAKSLIAQILSGLSYLHSHGIIHRDLKLSNLLLTQEGVLKIADFGLAVKLEDDNEEHFTICGTPNYIAPEISSENPHGLPVDLWAVGCLLYTMVAGRAPFQGSEAAQTFSNAQKGVYQMPEDLSPTGQHFLRSLLQKDPLKRLSVQDIQQHPFLTGKGVDELDKDLVETSLPVGETVTQATTALPQHEPEERVSVSTASIPIPSERSQGYRGRSPGYAASGTASARKASSTLDQINEVVSGVDGISELSSRQAHSENRGLDRRRQRPKHWSDVDLHHQQKRAPTVKRRDTSRTHNPPQETDSHQKSADEKSWSEQDTSTEASPGVNGSCLSDTDVTIKSEEKKMKNRRRTKSDDRTKSRGGLRGVQWRNYKDMYELPVEFHHNYIVQPDRPNAFWQHSSFVPAAPPIPAWGLQPVPPHIWAKGPPSMGWNPPYPTFFTSDTLPNPDLNNTIAGQKLDIKGLYGNVQEQDVRHADQYTGKCISSRPIANNSLQKNTRVDVAAPSSSFPFKEDLPVLRKVEAGSQPRVRRSSTKQAPYWNLLESSSAGMSDRDHETMRAENHSSLQSASILQKHSYSVESVVSTSDLLPVDCCRIPKSEHECKLGRLLINKKDGWVMLKCRKPNVWFSAKGYQIHVGKNVPSGLKQNEDKVYSLGNLPEKYRPIHKYIYQVVQLIKSRTPKVTLYLYKKREKEKGQIFFAKCMLMENAPFPDFIVKWTDKARLNYSLESGALRFTNQNQSFDWKPDKTSKEPVFNWPVNVPDSITAYMISAQTAMQRCLELEQTSSDFPVIIKEEVLHETDIFSFYGQSTFC